jgi:poly(hydroxyalkanoate) depolymerase family esterase
VTGILTRRPFRRSTRFEVFVRLFLLAAIVAGLPVAQSTWAGELRQKLFTAKPYDGSSDRRYQVYVPSSYTNQQPMPMVMVLHGCQQTETNMIEETRFRDLAEREGFLVVYPFITSYDSRREANCWGFFLEHHIHEGAGEVEDLYQIALEVEGSFAIDPARRYVTGLSSGAGMSIALAVAQSEYFAAAGSVAGLPYAESSWSVGFFCMNTGYFKPVSEIVAAIRAEQRGPEEQRQVPIMTIHSWHDCVVNVRASEQIRDVWISRYAVEPSITEKTDCTTEEVACEINKYGTATQSIVETVFYDGKRGYFDAKRSHYWVGDGTGEFADPQGPSASELQWTFFKAHPMANVSRDPVAPTPAHR